MENTENKRFNYEFGSFVLDPDERVLFVDGEPIRLPAKEFETLMLLVEHNGRALSKEEMISALWPDAFVEEGNLAKQISRLRKILKANGTELIETIPKHGYRFKADLRRVATDDDSEVLLEKRVVKRVKLAVETDEDAAPGIGMLSPGKAGPLRRWAGALIAVVLLSIGSVWYLTREMPPPAVRTIAVLPLRSLNGDEDGKAIGLGLADALITKLGSTRRIIIRPINSVTSFGEGNDPIDIGRRLGVDAVLEGTIQRAEGRMRVNARLIKIESGEQIWSERFEEPEAGIFALQDALSSDIARTLEFQLNKADIEKLAHRGTENVEAYEMYLRGRFYQSQNSVAGFNRSLELYQQAAALDPNFAEAHAGIADINVLKFNFGAAKDEVIPEARRAVNRALQLNPELSNAYTSTSLIQFLVDRDWAAAEQSLLKAIEIDPNNADAHVRYAYFLMRLGRFEESLEKNQRATELNPLSSIAQSNIGLTYLCARRYADAIEQLEKTTRENPDFSHAFWFLAAAHEAAGNKDLAFAANMRALEIDGGPELAAQLRAVRVEQGVEAANRVWFEKSNAAGAGVSALFVAVRAATIADKEQTLVWLEKAHSAGDTTLGGIRYLPAFDLVRGDPRFEAILKDLPY